jgi:hypothetical protein
MRNLALEIARSLETIEQGRGPFKVKCLVAQNPDDIQWDLILWADWFEADEAKRLEYLIDKIIGQLETDDLAQFNAIITFGARDETDFLLALMRIQDNYLKGFYQSVWGGDFWEVRTNLPQARLVVPLNRSTLDLPPERRDPTKSQRVTIG